MPKKSKVMKMKYVISQTVQNMFQEELLSNFAQLVLCLQFHKDKNVVVLFQIFYFLKDQ